MYFSVFSWKDIIVDGLGRALESIARYLFFFIGKFIYSAIRYVYNIFVALCNGRILDNDSIMALFSRIGVILGVVMLFVVSFSVIQLLVNPDAINDAEKGIQNIVKKVIFVIVMLGVSGYVFNILAEVQAIVIERDIIPKLLLPRAVSSENVGGNLSAELFMIFYQVGVEPEDDACGETYRDSTKAAIANGDFTPVSTCLTAGSGEGDGWVFFLEYNWLFSTIFGIAALWFIFSYCITVGVRLIQLTFLQIISPAAIIGYLSPKKDNIFSKWVKIYFSTYIDVFIRIAIINFAMYLIALIMSEYNSDASTFWTSVGSPGIWTKGFIAAIMITAILQFAKKAPELLKQLLPQGASGLGYSIKPGDTGLGMLGAATVGLGSRLIGGGAARIGHIRRNWNDENGNARSWRQRAGMIVGGIGGTALGGLIGMGGGFRGGKMGDSLKNSKAANDKFTQWSQIGGTSGIRRTASRAWGAVGGTTAGQRQKRNTEILQNYAKGRDAIENAAENVKAVKEAKKLYEAVLSGGQLQGETLEQYNNRVSEAKTNLNNIKNAVITAGYAGETTATYTDFNGQVQTIDDISNATIEIQANKQDLIRMQSENQELFNSNDYADISTIRNDWDSLDSNANKASANANAIQLTSNYRAAQANDSYNGNGGSK